MRKVATVLVFTLAVAWPLPARTSSAQSEHQTLDAQLVRRYRDAEVVYAKAREHFDRKDFERTREAIGACLGLVPAHANAHLLLAKVLYVGKDFAGALEEVLRAKSGHETTATLVSRMQEERMSGLRGRLAEKDDALSDLKARAAQSPGAAQALQQQILQVEGEKAEINRILNAQRPDPSAIPAEYSFFHGNVLLRLQRPAEAVIQYELALKANPGYGEAANNLAALHYSARRYDEAAGVVKEAEGRGVVINPELKKAIEAARAQPR